jgi:hypothetical protein
MPPSRRQTPHETPTERLATVLIGEPVAPWVAQQLAGGRSWRQIADDLRRLTGGQVDVPHQTVVYWHARHLSAERARTEGASGHAPDSAGADAPGPGPATAQTA